MYVCTLSPRSCIISAEQIMKMIFFAALFLLVSAVVLEAQTSGSPTVAEAEAFMNKAEARLAELTVKVSKANWVHDNFITDDTEALAAAANDELTADMIELVEPANDLNGIKRPGE